jgi:UrcA family protein
VVAPSYVGRDATRVSHFVSYKDLDLRYDGDVNVLRHRISDTASYGCSQLGEQGNRDCINDAVRNTQPQVREAVYYARHY